MQISFYVLGERYVVHDDAAKSTASAVNAEAVLNFVCKLTQTILKKSEHSMVIVDDNSERLQQLDKQLWEFDPTGFIPHHLIQSQSDPANHSLSSKTEDSTHPIDPKATTTKTLQASMLTAPVSLVSTLPQGFDGVVLNLAATALSLPNNDGVIPERILEIITPDDTSKQQGRDKYRYYRNLGYELIYYPID